jgi:S1-C subfamily serine protease
MVGKVIVIMLAVLLVLTGAVGVYSYHLTTEIDSLSEQLTTFREEATTSAAEIDSLSEQLTTLREEATTNAGTLNSMLTAYTQETNARLNIIDQNLQDGRDSILASELVIERNSELVSELEGVVFDIVEELAEEESWLQADHLYEAVSQSVIEVSDGANTIGSGFVYDDQGHVVTAYHVIEQLNSIYVVLPDGRISRASVVGSSSLSDVAVLQLERQFNVTPLLMANSESISIGEAAVTIGSPFDLGGTVTAGIVSQLNRFERIGDDLESRWISNLIQFDASVNFGNSGGPLFNVDGDVIGLIIARVGPTTGEGISYAVSANKVKRVADTIIEQGFFDYPWLGIEAGDITPGAAEELDRETIHGVLIGSVAYDSPAWKAGIQADDIITSINGKTIEGMADLTSYLGEYTSPGESNVVEIERSGVLIQRTVILGIK